MAGEGATGTPDAMTPMQALRTATILAAGKIGFEPDLVVLEGNPLEDIKATAVRPAPRRDLDRR